MYQLDLYIFIIGICFLLIDSYDNNINISLNFVDGVGFNKIVYEPHSGYKMPEVCDIYLCFNCI